MAFEWVSGAWAFMQKATAPVALAVASVSAAVLWVAPVRVLVRPEWMPYAAVAFLAAMVVGLAHLFEWLRSKLRELQSARSRVALLRGLTPQAKAVLGVLVPHEEVLRMDTRDGPVSLLHAAGILYRAPVSHGGFNFDFTLQPWARAALMEDPTLLDGAAQELEVRIFDRAPPWYERI